MIRKPIDVLHQHEVRKTAKQKQAFRAALSDYLSGKGYHVQLQAIGKKGNNIIIGNPEKAKLLVTAHYDTPARMFLPNLITPCNLWMFLFWQVLVVGLFCVLSAIPAIPFWLIWDMPVVAFMIWYVAYFLLFIILLRGPANPHNANDNTSGVVTLLEIAEALPQQLRDEVCFILFDLEETGLAGSAAYRKAHKKAIQHQLMLNMDCVGEGDEIVLFPVKKLRKQSATVSCLQNLEGSYGSKRVTVHINGFSYYPSDQRRFPMGVGIAALRRGKTGLYLSRIHTKRDIILEEENGHILRDLLVDFIGSYAAQ